MQITAVILAGGRGMRMGGVDKGLLEYQGKAMVEHVLERIQPQVDQVLVNANRNLEIYARYGVPVIQDANDHFDGPLAGFQAGMRHADTDWLLSVPCDSPILPFDLVQRLSTAILALQTMQVSQNILAIARSPSGIHPVFCLMPRTLSADLEAYLSSGERKVSGWQIKHSPVFVYFEDEQAFTNINQPLSPLR